MLDYVTEDERRKKKPATYQDVIDAPEHMVAEILDDELFLSPRPAPRHARASSRLGALLIPPFDEGNGGPGGWEILDEPELHFGRDVLVPDIAGWRRARLPQLPKERFFSLAPAWVCEVLSPSTEKIDRTRKGRLYARAGVSHMWMINPVLRMLEVSRLQEGRWIVVATHLDYVTVRAEPFEDFALDLSRLWTPDEPTSNGQA